MTSTKLEPVHKTKQQASENPNNKHERENRLDNAEIVWSIDHSNGKIESDSNDAPHQVIPEPTQAGSDKGEERHLKEGGQHSCI